MVDLASHGLNNPDIASELFISRNTVKAHLSHAYAKLGVTNRIELARLAARPAPTTTSQGRYSHLGNVRPGRPSVSLTR